MEEYMNILKEMSNQREKINIRNIIGGNRYGGKREKKGKIEKNKKVGCMKELIREKFKK